MYSTHMKYLQIHALQKLMSQRYNNHNVNLNTNFTLLFFKIFIKSTILKNPKRTK